MGKWCPVYDKKVVYLDCMECDNKEDCGKNDRYLPNFLQNTDIKENNGSEEDTKTN